MSDSSNSSSSGIGLFGLMFIVFLTLKLCGVIDWSWWWVTAPLWGSVAFVVVVLIVVFGGVFTWEFVKLYFKGLR